MRLTVRFGATFLAAALRLTLRFGAAFLTAALRLTVRFGAALLLVVALRLVTLRLGAALRLTVRLAVLFFATRRLVVRRVEEDALRRWTLSMACLHMCLALPIRSIGKPHETL
ncbi:MAG: hypothetical protein H7A36_05500 [Chlamydiales bacterium]|nr:hypothetical protein [Chlamydiales bacterium]